MFLFVDETLVIVSGERKGGIFTISSGLINFVMNLINCMGLEEFG